MSQKPSKKAVQKKKDKIVEDATFGLKNKNKSKKVQQFISRVETSVRNSNGGSDAAKAKEMKKEAQLAKQLQEEELRKLFNEGISNQFGKKKSKAANAASALGISEAAKEVAEFLEGMSSDSSSDDEGGEKRQTIYLEDEPDEVVVFRERTIEDIIEEQRASLAAEGKVGTPVTAESFAKWRAGKLQKRQAEAEARVKAEQTKRKGGKGLSVLSGKELFNYNASLFVDDDAAIDASEENAMTLESKQQEELENKRIKEETERAQAEQLRLFEIQRIELEARIYKEEERLRMSKLPTRATFILNNIIINQIIFEDDEIEDLEPFPEEVLQESFSAAIDSTEHEGSNNNDNNNNNNNNQEEDDNNNDDDGDGEDNDGDEEEDENDEN